jgi:hypothetical protein
MQPEITLDTLTGLQKTLDAYEQILNHATKNWGLLTHAEKLRAIDAFDTIAEIAERFE